MDNPKMKAFDSYVFVHEARHKSFLQMWKIDDLKYQQCCLRSSTNICALLWLLQLGQKDKYKLFLGILII